MTSLIVKARVVAGTYAGIEGEVVNEWGEPGCERTTLATKADILIDVPAEDVEWLT